MITAGQWKRAVQPCLSPDEDWGFRGKLAYLRPVGWVALGVLGEGSGSQKDRLYIWTLVMPLFVQTDHLILSYSRRLAPAGTFSPDERESFERAIRAAVMDLPSPGEALTRLARSSSSEVSGGAKVLMRHDSLATPDVERLRLLRDQTAEALGIR